VVERYLSELLGLMPDQACNFSTSDCEKINKGPLVRVIFFSFLPPSQETYEGKVTQLYSGFGVNFSSSSTNGDLKTLAFEAQILHSRISCGKGTAESSPKSLKKSPSNSSTNDRFWMVRP